MASDRVRFLLFPLPLVILFSVIFQLHMIVGDFDAHLNYRGDGAYPPGLAYILNALELAMPRTMALFLVALLAALYLPYVLVFEITKSVNAAWIYLYGSGVPMMLFFIWFVPQAIIHVLILMTILWWWVAVPFLLIGQWIHTAAFFGVALAVGYHAFKKMGAKK